MIQTAFVLGHWLLSTWTLIATQGSFDRRFMPHLVIPRRVSTDSLPQLHPGKRNLLHMLLSWKKNVQTLTLKCQNYFLSTVNLSTSVLCSSSAQTKDRAKQQWKGTKILKASPPEKTKNPSFFFYQNAPQNAWQSLEAHIKTKHGWEQLST